MNCKICSSRSEKVARGFIRGIHPTAYYQCTSCGFVQTDEPLWLPEAYTEAITRSDVGLVGRNLLLSRLTAVIIAAFFDSKGKFLDFGGGYGLLVRLMRDRGYDFYRSDVHCDNLFAHGFDADQSESGRYELLTAFEVFEHLTDPMSEVERMLSFSSSILFSTELVTVPAPMPENWSYYGLEHGQHVSFYTVAALRLIAEHFQLHCYTDGISLHLLTRKKLPPRLFALLSHYRIARLIELLLPKRSLLRSDFKRITGRELS